jgi:aminobenzoyl-glutamate transport protein
VRSLLSPDGIRFMVTSPVANFLGFTGVGVILVAMIGVGLAEESGLIATLVRKLVAAAPRSIFTFMIVFVGVMSSIAADAGYLVLVPLAAAAFHSMGRHPLAGLAAGFSGVAAVFLVNVFVTPTDALLVEVTNDAIRTVNPAAQINVVGNLFFMIASSIVMAIICTVLTEKYVEPRLGPYTGGLPIEETEGLSGSEQLGLKYAGRAALGFLVVILLLTAPPIPFGILRNQETGGIMAGSPFMSGLIVLISLLFLVVGYAYGRGAGTIANATAAIGLVVKTWSNLAGMIFLLFVIANFIAFFNYTNLATVLAVNLADFLQTLPIGGAGYIVLFVVTVAIIDIILTGALAKWAILAPVFIPLFMRLGGDPDLVMAAYRVGDSPMNVITPLNVYLAVMVGFAQKYQKDAGIGTIVALMLPYTGVLLVIWTLMLVAWYLVGLPLGPV